MWLRFWYCALRFNLRQINSSTPTFVSVCLRWRSTVLSTKNTQKELTEVKFHTLVGVPAQGFIPANRQRRWEVLLRVVFIHTVRTRALMLDRPATNVRLSNLNCFAQLEHHPAAVDVENVSDHALAARNKDHGLSNLLRGMKTS